MFSRVQKQKNPVAEHLNNTVPPTPASAPVIVHVDSKKLNYCTLN